MQRVWDFVIGALLAVLWAYWVGTQCYVDEVWKIWTITFVSGVGVMFMVVELRGAVRDARSRRRELAQMAKELRDSPDYGKATLRGRQDEH